MNNTALAASAVVKPVQAGAPRRDKGGFFAHHGIWAPGVRSCRRLSLRGNSIIISLVFALPIALLAWSSFDDKQASVRLSAHQRAGLLYVHDVQRLLHTAQRLRGLATVEAAGGKPQAALADARSAVDRALAQVQAREGSLGAELGTARAHTRLVQAGKEPAATGQDAERVFARHSRQVDAVLELFEAAAEGASLTVAPDADSAALLVAAVQTLPQLIDSAAQLRDRGVAALAGGAIDPAQMRHATEARARMDLLFARLDRSLRRVVERQPEAASELNLEAAARAIDGLRDQAAATLARDGAVRADLDAYLDAGTAATEALQVAADRLLARVDTQIAGRMQQLEGERDRLAAVTLLCLLLATYLFVCFRKVVKGGIDHLGRHMRAMRDGDLSQQPRHWGRDDLAELYDTTAAMGCSLRDMLLRLRGHAETLAQESKGVASGTQDLAERTDNTAQRLERITTSLAAMKDALGASAGATSAAAELATHNAELAVQGGAVIDKTAGMMVEISAAAGRIADINSTVDSIAFQTNILALNAAVEAARAGEHGKGFAVVAAEVRALAQRSAAAAREIKTLVGACVDKTTAGGSVAADASRSMADIVAGARQVNELLAQIAQTTRQHSGTIGDVSRDLDQLDAMTQQNAQLVEHTSAAARSMQQRAQELTAEAEHYRL